MRRQTDTIDDRLRELLQSLSHPPVRAAESRRERFAKAALDADSFSHQLTRLQHSLRAQPPSAPVQPESIEFGSESAA